VLRQGQKHRHSANCVEEIKGKVGKCRQTLLVANFCRFATLESTNTLGERDGHTALERDG